MSQGIEETICRFPYLSLHIYDFNANNHFMDSKNEFIKLIQMFSLYQTVHIQGLIYRTIKV